MNRYKSIKFFDQGCYSEPHAQNYIDCATQLNRVDSFQIDLQCPSIHSSSLLERLEVLDKELLEFDFLERVDGGHLFTLIYVPQKTINRRRSDLTLLDMGKIGTAGASCGKNVPKIYSNWQLEEGASEPIVHISVSPGWYLVSTGTMLDFCSLSYADQITKLQTHRISKLLSAFTSEAKPEGLIGSAPTVYIAGCMTALFVESSRDIPIRAGFLRTKSFFSDGTRIGILGSPYGFDIDGFWSGDGPGSNTSLALCVSLV